MEKLVIVYWSGSEWEGSTVMLPFEYESKAQAELDVLLAWQHYIELNKTYITEVNKARQAGNDVKEYMRLEKLRPKYTYMLGEQEVCLLDFTVDSFNGDKQVEYTAPVIYTLDEWFETFKKGQN